MNPIPKKGSLCKHTPYKNAIWQDRKLKHTIHLETKKGKKKKKILSQTEIQTEQVLRLLPDSPRSSTSCSAKQSLVTLAGIELHQAQH